MWRATQHGVPVIVKLLRSDSQELANLKAFAARPLLRVVPIVQEVQLDGWSAVIMPELTTLKDVFEGPSAAAKVAPIFRQLLDVRYFECMPQASFFSCVCFAVCATRFWLLGGMHDWFMET